MASKLLETLRHKDLIKRGKVNTDQIDLMSTSDILDLAKETVEITTLKDIKPEKSFFTHSSSISLSGGTFPCSGIDCRSRHLGELALFAALYSDRVYVRNYFSDYLQHGSIFKDVNSLRQRFATDINLLIQIAPLLEDGKITPVTPPNYCIHCVVENSFGKEADTRFGKFRNRLVSTYNKDVEYSLNVRDKKLVLRAEGPELLLEHPTNRFLQKIPDQIKNSPRLLSQLKSGKVVKLSRATIKEIGEDKRLAHRTVVNIAFDLSTSQHLGTSFLTERSLDAQALTEIFGDRNFEARNQIIEKYLTCLVPVAENVKLEDLIHLRSNEEDSFILFRNALGKAVDEYIKNNREFTERDAKQIYGEILQPQVARLNVAVQNAKKHFVQNTSAKVASWVGAISLGVYAGFLPTELAAAAGALGLVPLIANVANEILSQKNSEDQIRKEDIYFLWKVSQQKKS